ncbi:MAG: chlorite dismutase family protein [Reyranella sp.]|uniref:chlorite dismutase family protein n=1 Tax=Reyranella sp. TaxID=1929291 RepID=UPI0027319F56|nr:chlorite dismutase family protein [Reyranella sp.]MDP1961249.1 chlorite dismutase family protein [Reyranella sp.]MDP2375376.1 chlorite dismutase family protein [Reyranella sp.]
MPDPVVFSGGTVGAWNVTRVAAVRGAALATVARIDKGVRPVADAAWVLSGVTSNLRYTNTAEKRVLDATPSVLGRPAATRAALIPITKSAAWWALAQDERRAVLEEQSRHIAIGSEYLAAVSRQLVHCRDQPGAVFDFLTWFEFAPADEPRFDELLAKLRASPEWRFVEREVDLRLEKAA